MQTKDSQVSPRNWSNLRTRKKAESDRRRCNNCEKSNTSVEKPNNAYLTSVFTEKKLSDTELDPYNRQGCIYLFNSVKKYAKLLGKNLSITEEEGIRDLWRLSEQLQLLLPKNQECRLILRDGILSFKLVDRRNHNYLFHLPCKIIDETEGLFREILIDFFRLLQSKFDLDKFTDNTYLEFIREEYSDEPLDETDDYAVLVDRYLKGDISKTLSLIDPELPCDLNEFKKKIKKFSPYTSREKNLLKLIKEGIYFFQKKRSIYLMAEEFEHDPSYVYSIDIGASLQIIYDDDLIEENYIQFLNDSAQESGFDFFSAGQKEISLYSKKILNLDNYIVKFINWIEKLNNELYD